MRRIDTVGDVRGNTMTTKEILEQRLSQFYSKSEMLSGAISGERRGIVNREILFRGKRADTKEWIYGDVQHNVDVVKIREQEPNIQHVARSFVVIPETVGQYTGMKDKNGRRIFEGDIILPHGYKPEAYPVFYEDFCFRIDSNICVLCVADEEDIEVIGNIYDNPELLESAGKDAAPYADQPVLMNAT